MKLLFLVAGVSLTISLEVLKGEFISEKYVFEV